MNTISNHSIAEVNSVKLSGKGQAEGKEVQNDVKGNTSVNEQAVSEAESVEMTSRQMEKVAQQLQVFVGEMNKGLEFSVHQDSGRDVIKVIDKSSGDLIKQYPTEEVLDLVSKLSEAAGSFINEEV